MSATTVLNDNYLLSLWLASDKEADMFSDIPKNAQNAQNE